MLIRQASSGAHLINTSHRPGWRLRAMRFWTLLALASAVRASPGACLPPQGGAAGFVATFYLMDYAWFGSGPEDVAFMETGYRQQLVTASTPGVTTPAFALETPFFAIGPSAGAIYGQTVDFTNVGVQLQGYFVPPELGVWTLFAATDNAVVVRVGAASAFECCQATVLEVGDYALYLVGQAGTASYVFTAGLHYPLMLFWVNYHGDAVLLFSMTSPSGHVYTDFGLLVVAIPDGAPCPAVATTTVYGAVAATSTQLPTPGGTVTVVVAVPYSTLVETLYWTGGAEDWTALGGATETIEVLLPAQTTTATTYGPLAGTATLDLPDAATVTVVITEPYSVVDGATATLAPTAITTSDAAASAPSRPIAAVSPSALATGSPWPARMGSTSAARFTGASRPAMGGCTNGTLAGVEAFGSASFASSAVGAPSLDPTFATTALAGASAVAAANTGDTLGSDTDVSRRPLLSISAVSARPSDAASAALTPHAVTQALSPGPGWPGRATSFSRPPVPASWAVPSRLADSAMASPLSQAGSLGLANPAEARGGAEVSGAANSSPNALSVTIQADASVTATWCVRSSSRFNASGSPRTGYRWSLNRTAGTMAPVGVAPASSTAAATGTVSSATSTAASLDHKVTPVLSPVLRSSVHASSGFGNAALSRLPPSLVLPTRSRALSIAERLSTAASLQTWVPVSNAVAAYSAANSTITRGHHSSPTSMAHASHGADTRLATIHSTSSDRETRGSATSRTLSTPSKASATARFNKTLEATVSTRSKVAALHSASLMNESSSGSSVTKSFLRHSRGFKITWRGSSAMRESSATADSPKRTLHFVTVPTSTSSTIAALHPSSREDKSLSTSTSKSPPSTSSCQHSVSWRSSSTTQQSTTNKTLHYVTVSTHTVSKVLYTGSLEAVSVRFSMSLSTSKSSVASLLSQWRSKGFTTIWRGSARESSATACLNQSLHISTLSKVALPRASSPGDAAIDTSAIISRNSKTSLWHPSGFTTTRRSRSGATAVSYNKSLHSVTLSSLTPSKPALNASLLLDSTGSSNPLTSSQWHTTRKLSATTSLNVTLHYVTTSTFTVSTVAVHLSSLEDESLPYPSASSQQHIASWRGSLATRESRTMSNKTLHSVAVSTSIASTIAALRPSSLEDPSGSAASTLIPSMSSQGRYHGFANTTRLLRGRSATSAVSKKEAADPSSSVREGSSERGLRLTFLLTAHTTVDSASSVPLYVSNSAYGSAGRVVPATAICTTETVPPSGPTASALNDTAVRLDLSSTSAFVPGYNGALTAFNGSAARPIALTLSIRGSGNAQSPTVDATIATIGVENSTHRASGYFAPRLASNKVPSHSLSIAPGSVGHSAVESPAASTEPPLVADTTVADPKPTPTATLTVDLSNGYASVVRSATTRSSLVMRSRSSSASLSLADVTSALGLSLAPLSSETGAHSGGRHLSSVGLARSVSSGLSTALASDPKLAPSAPILDPTQGVWLTPNASAYTPGNRTAAALVGGDTLEGPRSSLAELKSLLGSPRRVSTGWLSHEYTEALSVSLTRLPLDGQPSQAKAQLPLSTSTSPAADSHRNASAWHGVDSHSQAAGDFTLSQVVNNSSAATAYPAIAQPTLLRGMASSGIERSSKTVHSVLTGPPTLTGHRLSPNNNLTPAKSTSTPEEPSETDPLGDSLVTDSSTQTLKSEYSSAQDEADTEAFLPLGPGSSMPSSVEPGCTNRVASEPLATIAVTSCHAAPKFASYGSSSRLIVSSHEISTSGKPTATKQVLSNTPAPRESASQVSMCTPPTLQQSTYLASTPVPQPSVPVHLHNTGCRLQPCRKKALLLLSALHRLL